VRDVLLSEALAQSRVELRLMDIVADNLSDIGHYAKSLAEKYGDKGVRAYALHPGVVNTSIWDSAMGFLRVFVWVLKLFMITPKKGAETTIYLATQPKLEQKSGLYFKKCKVAKTAPIAEDAGARNRLWDISEKLLSVNK